jgi:hypothetical protein
MMTDTLLPLSSILDEKVLHQIFSFSHMKPSTNQDNESIFSMLELLIKSNGVDVTGPFATACHYIRSQLMAKQFVLFGEYGCAFYYKHNPDDGHVNIYLLGLDEWKFSVHASYEDDGAAVERSHTCHSAHHAVLSVGIIHADEVPLLLDRLSKLLTAARTRKDDQRSAGHNQQGHQKTPSFILALLKEAYVDRDHEKTFHPLGGFTDVGMHTGSSPRPTVWPLLVALLKELLSDDDGYLLDKCLSNFYIWMIVTQLSSTKGSNFFCWISASELNKVDAMICTAAKHIEHYCDEHCLDSIRHYERQLTKT